MEPFVVYRPKCSSGRLEGIEEENPTENFSLACAPPETPTETMEFLARSWSLSAMELSKALTDSRLHTNVPEIIPFCSPAVDVHVRDINSTTTTTATATKFLEDDLAIKSQSPHSFQQLPALQSSSDSPPIPPMEVEEAKELFLLHQALNPDFISHQQLLKNGIYKNVLRGKTVGRWLKDQKEKKKQEIRTHNAQLHAAMSVASVAAAVAAVAAATAAVSEKSTTQNDESSKTSAAVASASALVASHCVEIAKEMGADRDQILSVVNSAVNVRTAGDIMTLTAGAATALRGAATLKARLQKGYRTASLAPTEEQVVESKDVNMSSDLDFVFSGGELLKRTRKGALHWKRVSFNIDSNGQVIAKMKSKHMGAFTKKKKCVVSDVFSNVPSWIGRETEDGGQHRAYFGIKTADRLIEFECRSKSEKQKWIYGIRHLLHRHTNMICEM